MGETRFIKAGSLIDGSGSSMRRLVFLAIRDGCIADIGPAADLPRDGGPVDDFSHCVIVPALVDSSVFLTRSPSVDEAVRRSAAEALPERKAAMLARHIRYCHVHGVLGVADNDDPTDLAATYRRGARQGELVVIRTSGRLCQGSGDCSPGRLQCRDFLRIEYSPDIESEAEACPWLNPEELHRIRRSCPGKKTVVVANGPERVAEALAAGCDAIEQGYGMGEANLLKMAEKGVLWIPSIVRARNALDGSASGGAVACRFSTRYVAPGKPVPGAEAYWKKMLAGQVAQLGLARKLGVITATGTGAGSAGILHGESMVEEMKLFLRAGYSLAETIRSASANGAGFFGMERLGPLAVGRPATFLIARGTVQQLPRKLAYLEGIYIDGAPSPSYRKHPVRDPAPAARGE